MRSRLRSLSECWDDWASATAPPFSKILFQNAAILIAQRLRFWLEEKTTKPFVIFSTSFEEALAALACAVEEPTLAKIAAKEIFVAASSTNDIISILEADIDLIPIAITDQMNSEISRANPFRRFVFVSHYLTEYGPPHVKIDLTRRDAYLSGLQAMGVETEDIMNYASSNGYSRTILRRTLAIEPEVRSPFFPLDQESRETWLPIVLVGSWQSDNNSDRQFVAQLGSFSYDMVASILANLESSDTSRLQLQYKTVICRSKLDFLYALSKSLKEAHIVNFLQSAEKLFQNLIEFSLFDSKSVQGSTPGPSSFSYSSDLVYGLLETLCLLKDHSSSILDLEVSASISSFVTRVYQSAGKSIWGFEYPDIAKWAEVDPDIFLDFLEADLNSNEPASFIRLDTLSVPDWIDRRPRGVVGALEIIAWGEEWFPRAVALLCRLWSAPVPTYWKTHIKNVISGLFTPWIPQTTATVSSRLLAVSRMIIDSPDLAWSIIFERFRDIGSPGHRNLTPVWRPEASEAGFAIPLEHIDVLNFRTGIFEYIVQWRLHTDDTISDLISLMPLGPDNDETLWRVVNRWLVSGSRSDLVKRQLRDQIRASGFLNLATSDTCSHEIQKVWNRLIPNDSISAHIWLFVEDHIGGSAGSWDFPSLGLEARERRLRQERENVLREIWRDSQQDIWIDFGYSGIYRLCRESKVPWLIGSCLVTSGLTASDVANFIHTLYKSGFNCSNDNLDDCLFGMVSALDEDQFAQILLQTIHMWRERSGYSDSTLIALLKSIPLSESVIKVIGTIPHSLKMRYWTEMQPPRLYRQSSFFVNEVIHHLFEVDRPLAAFCAVEAVFEKVMTENLLKLQDGISQFSMVKEGEFKLRRFYVERCFQELKDREDAPMADVFRLELVWQGWIETFGP